MRNQPGWEYFTFRNFLRDMVVTVVALALLGYLLSLSSCGDMGRISNQSYHCMVEGGDDYCRPAPRGTPVQGPQGIPGDRGPTGRDGHDGAAGAPGERGPAGELGYSLVTSTEALAEGSTLCPYGGTLLRIAQDSNRNGSWDSTDSGQQEVSVCRQAPAEQCSYTIEITVPSGGGHGHGN